MSYLKNTEDLEIAVVLGRRKNGRLLIEPTSDDLLKTRDIIDKCSEALIAMEKYDVQNRRKGT